MGKCKYLDYWSGLHKPSISGALREIPIVEGENIATPDARLATTLFPLRARPLSSTTHHLEWPRVMLIHGSKDTVVPNDSSLALRARLQDVKVEATTHCPGHGARI